VIKKINTVKNFNAGKNCVNQQCQQWTQTFQNRTFLHIKWTNNQLFNHTIVTT